MVPCAPPARRFTLQIREKSAHSVRSDNVEYYKNLTDEENLTSVPNIEQRKRTYEAGTLGLIWYRNADAG
jgi:hypothetical protein